MVQDWVLPDDQDMNCDGFFGTDLHIDICCASAAPRVPAELAGRRESSPTWGACAAARYVAPTVAQWPNLKFFAHIGLFVCHGLPQSTLW